MLSKSKLKANKTELRNLVKLSILFVAKMIGLFRLGRFLTRQGLMIVCWHGVSLNNEHERFKSLFISPESLKKRLNFLTNNYKVIDLDTAIEQHKSGKFKPNQVVITFDDGYYNFFAKAVPILREFGVAATNYIVTDHMNKQRQILNLLIRDIIVQSSKKTVELSMPNTDEIREFTLPKDQNTLTKTSLAVLQEQLADYESKLDFANQLAKQLGVNIEDLIRNRVWHSMNQLEIKRLSEEKFSMQIHSDHHWEVIDHFDSVQNEAEICKSELERVTGKRAVHFCYPSGIWFRKAWEQLQQAGVQSAVTTMQGPNFPKTPILALRRVLNGEDRNQLEFEFEMSNLKWLFHVLLYPNDLYAPNEKTKSYVEEKRVF